MTDVFFNPYNFVRTPFRDTNHSELGDHVPLGHSRLHDGTWSGRLVVTMTAATPLLIPSSRVTAHAAVQDHKIKRTRRRRVDNVVQAAIPPSSVKGMIRAAYEMVTNSRFAVFAGHDDRLAMREPVDDGLIALPAIVTTRDGKPWLQLMLGTASYDQLVPNGDGYLQAPGRTPLAARIKIEEAERLDLGRGISSMVDFTCDDAMFVTKVWKLSDESPRSPGAHTGYLHQTGRAKVRKSHERIFFSTGAQSMRLIPLTDELANYWRSVIKNSRVVHEDSTDKDRPLYLQEKQRRVDDWTRLDEYDTCYVRIRRTQENGTTVDTVELVQPVSIGRQLHPLSPAEVLHHTLRPAGSLAEFSPAERIFGWVSPDGTPKNGGPSAYAGHLRFGQVHCMTDDAIATFESPRVVATLNSPKPSMARFYVGTRADDGSARPAQQKRPKKTVLYDTNHVLRGRKVYPHHGGFDAQSVRWQSHPQRDRDGRSTPAETKTNYTITDWIKPGSTFEFSIDFRNLTEFEVGALLLSIETGEGECHRLGGAKPLGFGAVNMVIDSTRSRVLSADDYATEWASLAEVSPEENSLDRFRDRARSVLSSTSHWKDFHSYLKGYTNSERIPVLYPRSPIDSTDSGAILQWFTENERLRDGVPLHGVSLPLLGNSRQHALPALVRQNTNGGRRQGGRPGTQNRNNRRQR